MLDQPFRILLLGWSTLKTLGRKSAAVGKKEDALVGLRTRSLGALGILLYSARGRLSPPPPSALCSLLLVSIVDNEQRGGE
eukprot:scaffold108330_cov19-Tisochrysis_lutea.AAC.1